MRLVQDVDGAYIKPEDMEIGQLVNGEPELFYPEGAKRLGVDQPEGTELNQDIAKAAIIIVRMNPEDITPDEGPRGLGSQRHPLLLQDLHPRRLPDLAVGAADPQPAVPVPPVDLRPRRQRQGGLRPGRTTPAAAADLSVDAEGYLIASSDFTEPVGPSFWERG